METGEVIAGVIVLAVGLVVLVIGLSPEMTCSVISASGGNCVVAYGRLFVVDDSFKFVPPLILGVGSILALTGGAISVLGALKKGEGAGPQGPA